MRRTGLGGGGTAPIVAGDTCRPVAATRMRTAGINGAIATAQSRQALLARSSIAQCDGLWLQCRGHRSEMPAWPRRTERAPMPRRFALASHEPGPVIALDGFVTRRRQRRAGSDEFPRTHSL